MVRNDNWSFFIKQTIREMIFSSENWCATLRNLDGGKSAVCYTLPQHLEEFIIGSQNVSLWTLFNYSNNNNRLWTTEEIYKAIRRKQ